MSRGPGRFARWLQQVMDSDGRYICAACDDRFHGRMEGTEHVLRCHPEFAGVTLTLVDDGPMSVVEPASVRTTCASPATPMVPAALWN